MKELYFVGTEIKTPPLANEARREIGFLLRLLQKDMLLSLPHSRPMPSIGKGCHELRINDKNRAWRVIYYIDTEAIVILDVFPKKTNKTPQKSISVCQRRLKIYKNQKRG
jgi:phage-related protein